MDNFYPIIVTEKKRTYTHVKSGKVYTMPVGKSQRAQSIGKRFRVHSGCEGNSPKRDLNGTYVSEDELIILKEHRKKPKKSTTKSSEQDKDEKKSPMNMITQSIMKKIETRRLDKDIDWNSNSKKSEVQKKTENTPAIFVCDDLGTIDESKEPENKGDKLNLDNLLTKSKKED